MSVTREIISAVTSRSPDDYPALRSLAGYKAATTRSRNWRDLYAREFGFAEDEIDSAGALWADYQHRSTTDAGASAGYRIRRDVPRAMGARPMGTRPRASPAPAGPGRIPRRRCYSR